MLKDNGRDLSLVDVPTRRGEGSSQVNCGSVLVWPAIINPSCLRRVFAGDPRKGTR